MPAPTRKQKEQFANDVFDQSLEWATDWIQDNMTPEEVFGEDELKEWIQNNKKPEDMYDEDDLIGWAEANGFKKED